VYSEIQQKKDKKQTSKQLKYIKPFILILLTGYLTVQKITINALGIHGKPKEKAQNPNTQTYQLLIDGSS
jgi:hypothetical protein